MLAVPLLKLTHMGAGGEGILLSPCGRGAGVRASSPRPWEKGWGEGISKPKG